MSDQIPEEIFELSGALDHTSAFNHIVEVNFDSLSDHEIELLIDELSSTLRKRSCQLHFDKKESENEV